MKIRFENSGYEHLFYPQIDPGHVPPNCTRSHDPLDDWRSDCDTSGFFETELVPDARLEPFGFPLRNDGSIEVHTARRKNYFHYAQRQVGNSLVSDPTPNDFSTKLYRRRKYSIPLGLPFSLNLQQTIRCGIDQVCSTSAIRRLGSTTVEVYYFRNGPTFYHFNPTTCVWTMRIDEDLTGNDDAFDHFKTVECSHESRGSGTYAVRLGTAAELYSNGIDVWCRVGSQNFTPDMAIDFQDPVNGLSIISKSGRDRIIVKSVNAQRVFETAYRSMNRNETFGLFWVEKSPIIYPRQPIVKMQRKASQIRSLRRLEDIRAGRETVFSNQHLIFFKRWFYSKAYVV